MALVVADRVKETTTTTGTGAITLAGATTNFVTFSSVLSNGDTTYYAIVDDANTDFEVGLGTYASSGNTLTRTTVLASTNSGSAVNLSAGSKEVFINYPAGKSVYLDGSSQLVIGGTAVTATAAELNLLDGATTATGSGALVLATSPTLVTPALGTPASGNLGNCTADGTDEVGFRNAPPVGTKTSAYTLVVGDVGKYVQVGSSGSIVIPNATFAEGDVISVFNNTAGDITITCTITTAYKAGEDSDIATATLATRGVATILFISATVCVITGNI